jgi:large subunit ribosomal protein L21
VGLKTHSYIIKAKIIKADEPMSVTNHVNEYINLTLGNLDYKMTCSKKRGEKIYAIVETGGKQYKVAPKQTIEVERLNIPEGETVKLDKVLFISDNDNTLIGNPTIKGANVIATSLGEVKGNKIIVFKYKPKIRYRKKTGHRQIYTRLSINEIVKPADGSPKNSSNF